MESLSSNFFLLFFLSAFSGTLCMSENTKRSFTLVNECKETIWPGITSGKSSEGGGFILKAGQSAIYTAPPRWNGRIWARTGCDFDKDGNGTCQTGSCGSVLNCTGPGVRPSTIADFTLGEIDYYDVSLVDGFNVPIVVKTVNGKGNCSSAGCDGDLRDNCPPELALKSEGKVVACRSACQVLNADDYCCTGQFGNPITCLPTNYSRVFKQVCPAAYSYAYDDPTSILTCSNADYIVTFCASRKQTVCSYKDKHVVCNGAEGFSANSGKWRRLMLPFVGAYFFLSSGVLSY